jgi:hypothetical protein
MSNSPDHLSKQDTEKMQKVLTPGKCTGDFYIVTNTKWRSHNVVCLENSKIIYVPLESIEKKIRVYFQKGNDNC